MGLFGILVFLFISSLRVQSVVMHLLTRMDACVDTGNILGMNSHIYLRDTGISLVQSYNIQAVSELRLPCV